MTYTQIVEALIGFMLWDSGERETGIHNDYLRQKLIIHIQGLDAGGHRALIAKIAVDCFLSPEAVALGYGAEDAMAFFEWCDRNQILVTD